MRERMKTTVSLESAAWWTGAFEILDSAELRRALKERGLDPAEVDRLVAATEGDTEALEKIKKRNFSTQPPTPPGVPP
jgi:hypothetical protein